MQSLLFINPPRHQKQNNKNKTTSCLKVLTQVSSLIVEVFGEYQIQDLISVATTASAIAAASSTTSSTTAATIVTIAVGLIVSIGGSSNSGNIGNVTGNWSVDIGDSSTTFSWDCESRAVENNGLVPAEENNEKDVKIPKAESGDHGDDDCATHLESF
jgi:hypothetical protein